MFRSTGVTATVLGLLAASVLGWATNADDVGGRTSLRETSFAVVALAVDANLAVSPVSHLSGTGPVATGALVTPEGLLLSRAGATAERVYPFEEQGEPFDDGVGYPALSSGTWTELFQ